MKQTSPKRSSTSHEPNSAIRKEQGAQETPPRRAWRAEHVGERRNHGDGAVGTKTKRSSHSGAHRDHVGRLGEGGGVLDRRDHVRPRMAELRPAPKKTKSRGGAGLPRATRSGLG